MKINRDLLKGSLTLLIAFGIFNVLNFIFQAGMARLLTLAQFGILSALFQIIYIFTGFSESIQITLAKYTAKESSKGKVKNIMKRSLRKTISLAIGLYVVYLVISIPISSLLKIDYLLVSFTGLALFIVFLTPVVRGIMQGKKKFLALSFNIVLEGIVKVALSIFLVILGFGVLGALGGVIVSGLVAFALSFISLKEFIHSKEEKADIKDIYEYSWPSFTIIMAVLIFYSFDLILVKIFFSSEISGSYAVASLLAKSIFFGTHPISKAMFPISADNNLKKNKSEGILTNSVMMVLILALAVLMLFSFAPAKIITLFSGKVIQEAESILLILGLGMTALSLSNLVLLYKLSKGKIKNHIGFMVFVIIEIVALALYLSIYNPGLVSFSIAFVIACFFFFCGSIFLVREANERSHS